MVIRAFSFVATKVSYEDSQLQTNIKKYTGPFKFLFLPAICWKEIAEEIFFFHISIWCLTWDTNPGFGPNKPTHYLLDHDFFRSPQKQRNQLLCRFFRECIKNTKKFGSLSLPSKAANESLVQTFSGMQTLKLFAKNLVLTKYVNALTLSSTILLK